MKTIQEIFELNRQAGDKNNFGVEIELENIDKRVRVDGWRDEHDGSLRHLGREFVFSNPQNLKSSEKLLQGLYDTFKELGVKPSASNLTSTHIHIDVRDLNVKQLIDFIACILVVEPDLMNASGKDRQNNYFALSTSESEHRLADLMKVKDANTLKHFVLLQVRKDVRYCGINFNSLMRYGSLEIRYLAGQEDPRNVMPWLTFYAHLKDFARHGVNFNELFETVSEHGTATIRQLFEPPFELTQEGLLEGLRNAQDIVYPLATNNLMCPQDGNGLREFYKEF